MKSFSLSLVMVGLLAMIGCDRKPSEEFSESGSSAAGLLRFGLSKDSAAATDTVHSMNADLYVPWYFSIQPASDGLVLDSVHVDWGDGTASGLKNARGILRHQWPEVPACGAWIQVQAWKNGSVFARDSVLVDFVRIPPKPCFCGLDRIARQDDTLWFMTGDGRRLDSAWIEAVSPLGIVRDFGPVASTGTDVAIPIHLPSIGTDTLVSWKIRVKFLDHLADTGSDSIVLPLMQVPLLLVKRDTFTDVRDTTTYRMVTVGAQTWLAENLRYKATGSLGHGSDSLDAQYGRLYSWNVAMAGGKLSNNGSNTSAQGICPDGWRLPLSADFVRLDSIAALSGGSGEVLAAKNAWNEGHSGADLYGFAAVPAGMGSDGVVGGVGSSAYFWTGEMGSSSLVAAKAYMDWTGSEVSFQVSEHDTTVAYSVRCLKR
jgi:uncharacterized protein (TIGR02145 family)